MMKRSHAAIKYFIYVGTLVLIFIKNVFLWKMIETLKILEEDTMSEKKI